MKATKLLIAMLLGLCLAALICTTSCCVSKLFEDDDEPYTQDLNLPS